MLTDRRRRFWRMVTGGAFDLAIALAGAALIAAMVLMLRR
jgi:hypothetical protein